MAWLETWLSPNDTNDRLLTETLDSVTPGADRHTVYSYSVTEQTAKDVYEGLTSGGTLLEEHSYEYNLQGRQFKATVTKDGSTTVIETA